MPIFSEIESRELEFKEYLERYDGIIKTVIAFSNDIGGRIVVGVQDGTREIVGLSDTQIDKYLEELPSAIYDAVAPYCLPQIVAKRIDQKAILEIRVYPGSRKPYYLKSEGSPKGVYIRIGSHNRRVTPELLEDLMRESRREYFDTEIVREAVRSDLSAELLKTIYKSALLPEGLLIADNVLKLDPLTQILRPTIVGCLFFCPNPMKFIPSAEVVFTHFAAKDTDKILRTQDLSLPIELMASRLVEELEPLLAIESQRKGIKLMVKRQSIPVIAIREALLNALVHRKYSITAPVKVALFRDRLEVFSPGNFPGAISIKDIEAGISYMRNPHIAALARKAGLVEKRGLGLRLIIESCRKNGNPDPVIIEKDDYVKVVLYREVSRDGSKKVRPIGALPAEFLAFEQLYQARSAFNIRDAVSLLKVSPNAARARLHKMRAIGLISVLGRGKATRYYWQ